MNNFEEEDNYGRGPPTRHPRKKGLPSQGYADHRMDRGRHHNGDRHGRDQGHRGGKDHKHRPPKPLLDEAIQELEDMLNGAIDFYGRFAQDFGRDVQQIKPYANSEILTCLWASKVRMNDDRRRGGGDPSKFQERDGSEPGRHQGSSSSFRNLAAQIQRSFQVALASRPSKIRESDIDAENADRILKKISQAYKDTYKLLSTAPKRHADVNALVTELEVLSTFLERSGPQRERHEEMGQNNNQDAEQYGGDNQDGYDGHEEEQAALLLE